MVERDLAKVEVASSTLVSRSKISEATQRGPQADSVASIACSLETSGWVRNAADFKSQTRIPKSQFKMAA